MPPPKSNLALSPDEVATIRRWIEQGAEWKQHWSFIPPIKSTPPAVKNRKWPRNEIDRFVLARIERENQSPAPEADRERLIRRAAFDLT